MSCRNAGVLPVGVQVFFTPFTAAQAQDSPFCQTHAAHFVEVGGAHAIKDSQLLHISVIHHFCEYMQGTVDSHRDKSIVICPEDSCSQSVANACLLCGAYLLLCERRALQHVLTAFESTLSTMARCRSDSVMDCWRALEHARALRWLGAADASSEPLYDVEMAAHYACPINGHVHVLVPGRLLLFPAPALLPAGQEWAQAPSSGSTARVFSAGFLADLLADLGVSSVACVGQTSGRDAAAFAARGLDVHDLGLDPRRPALLRAVDQLLTVSRASPGAVAVFGGDGEALPKPVRTLVAACLMVELGFSAGAASAWIRMLCPALAV